MRAITICQPYAALIADGAKRVENRRWKTEVRGRIAIHAGKSREWLDRYTGPVPAKMDFGAIVATAELIDCVSYTDVRVGEHGSAYDFLLSDRHATGPYCFILDKVRKLAEPIPWSGSQMFWVFPDDKLPAYAR